MSLQIISSLREWAPFNIDALGLVTILGAQGADRVLGQLTANRFVDWLPMLGSYVIANNQITEPLSGFSLHNITDGIVATDLAGWFNRWLLCQDFKWCSSSITIMVSPPSAAKRQKHITVCAAVFGILSATAIVVPAIINDWWGLANGIAMLISVLVRQIVLGQNRLAVDTAVATIQTTADLNVKIFVILPNGKAIILYTTRGIVTRCLLSSPEPRNPKLYNCTRSLGWLAFGTHVISLGMACFISQLLAVVLMISSTILACWQIGTDRDHVGSRLEIKRRDDPVPF